MVIRGQQEWEVQDIINHAISQHKGKTIVEFCVKWKGPFEDSWHEPSDLENSPDLLHSYLYKLNATERRKVARLIDRQLLSKLSPALQELGAS